MKAVRLFVIPIQSVIFVTLSLGAAWAVHTRWSRPRTPAALDFPAVVDSATPLAQSGVELTDIQWISPENPIAFSQDMTAGQRPYGSTIAWFSIDPQLVMSRTRRLNKDIQFLCRTPKGDVPLEWQLSDVQRAGAFVEIPPGYSDETKALEIVAKINGDAERRWRLTQIPSPRRVVDGPATTRIGAGGVSISGHSIPKSPSSGLAGLTLHVDSRAKDGLVRTVTVDKVDYEWAEGNGVLGGKTGTVLNGNSESQIVLSPVSPFAYDSRWMRVHGVVRRYRSDTRRLSVDTKALFPHGLQRGRYRVPISRDSDYKLWIDAAPIESGKFRLTFSVAPEGAYYPFADPSDATALRTWEVKKVTSTELRDSDLGKAFDVELRHLAPVDAAPFRLTLPMTKVAVDPELTPLMQD